MDKKEKELYNELINKGYSKKFAELCVDSMVDEERMIGEIVGCLEEIYYARMSEVDGASDGMKEFVSGCIKERLSCMSHSFNTDPYATTGMDLIDGSDLYTRARVVYGGVYFIIFDDEADAPEVNTMFWDVVDWLIFHEKIKKKVIEAVNAFGETEKENNAESNEERNEWNEGKPVGAYNAAIRWMKDHKSHEAFDLVSRLVSDYPYGLCIHKELEELMKALGVDFD